MVQLSRKSLQLIVGGLMIGASANRADAQFSAQDGYAEGGGYRVQVELTPYLWLPASSGTIRLGGNLGRDFDFDSGPPTIADLAHSLHGAFIGNGLLRYGPWSVELDTQWIDAFHKTSVQVDPNGPGGTLKDTLKVFRIAPGLGYEVYSGGIAGVPAISIRVLCGPALLVTMLFRRDAPARCFSWTEYLQAG